MSIESEIYARLSSFTTLTALVSNRVYPTEPTENTQLPFLVYQVTAAETNTHTQGAASLTKYTLEVNTFGQNVGTVLAILTEVKAALHCYRGGTIQGAFLSTEQTAPLEDGYQGQQTYTVNASTVNVTATIDSTGSIITGNNSVTLNACSNTLSLDCTGLKLNGNNVVPDLTDYARKDQSNTFATNQTVLGNVTIGNGTTSHGTLTIKNTSDDLVVIDNTSDGRIRLNATGPHAQSMDIWARNGTTGGPGFGGSGDLAIVAGSAVLKIGNDSNSPTFQQLLATGGSCIFIPKDSGSIGIIIRGQPSQSSNLQQWRDSSNTVLSSIHATGSLQPASMADSAAPSFSIYYSTTVGKLVFKDSGGTVSPLY